MVEQVDTKLEVAHFVRGQVVWPKGDETDQEYFSRDFGVPFVTPELVLGELFEPRNVPGPLFDVPLREIIDLFVETGKHLDLATNAYLQESLELTLRVSALPRRIVENTYARPGAFLTREGIQYRLERTFGDTRVLDGWTEFTDPSGSVSRLRAFPPRLVHMMAGNSPSGALMSLLDGTLVKGVNVYKMPSSDPFTTVALLRTMNDIAPGHPVLRSISAVYWRGGDDQVESVLYRSQYFDKLIAWGGGAAISSAAKYIGPGFQLISFDPKTSMAIVGREAFQSQETLEEVAELAALDATVYNQDACLAARQICVEADDPDDVDRFCEVLLGRLGVERQFASAVGPKTPTDIREAVDGLRWLEPEYRVFGEYDGSGLVVRSPAPVDFHPTAKTVNVIPVKHLVDAADHATVATQTVGVFPDHRKAEVRDRLAGAGVQRIVKLGSALRGSQGSPHDGMYPLHRMVNWVVDDDA